MSVIRKSSRPIRTLLSLTQSPVLARQMSALTESKAFKKLKEKQARMQCDDGLPVYLKNGSADRMLYNITVALLAGTSLGSFVFLFRNIIY